MSGEAASPLKAAFAEARRQSNIDLVLEPLLATKLFVFGGAPEPGDTPGVFLTRMPGGEGYGWTAAESLAIAEGTEGVIPLPYEGRDVFWHMPPAHGLVLVWEDGGDVLTADHLAWLRRLAVDSAMAQSKPPSGTA